MNVALSKAIFLIPKSRKAKNRLANSMNNDPVMFIEQETEEQVFAVSGSKEYCRWIRKSNDPDFDYMHFTLEQ